MFLVYLSMLFVIGKANLVKLIDSHTHAEYFFQNGTEDSMRSRAQSVGVVHALNVGTGSKDWELYRKATSSFPDFYSYSVGLHPCHVDVNWGNEIDCFGSWLSDSTDPNPVAWGEMGLDYFHLPKERSAATDVVRQQKESFLKQLQLVQSDHRPIIIHCRNAFQDTVQMIESAGVDWKRVVFHCFTFGVAEMKALLERGGRASFTGIITYKNTEYLQESLIMQGLDLLMLETDAPWLSPNPLRGAKNEPGHLVHIADSAALLLGVSPNQLAEATSANAISFFGLPIPPA